MSNYEYSVDVNVPVRVAYNQWTQFEQFPSFMEGVQEVRQLDDQHLFWRVEIGGVERAWYAKVTEQTPDQRVAWTSTSGAKNAGVVTFHHIDDTTTRIMLQIDYEPEDLIENVGDLLGIVKSRMASDLERFKTFIEERGAETGAWRGTVERPEAG